MKTVIIKYLIIASIISILFSCDVDRYPKQSIHLENSFNSIDDATNWNNGMLSTLRYRQYGNYVTIQALQADQLNASSGVGNRGGESHSWIKFLSTNVMIAVVWQDYYSALKNVNKFIELSEVLKSSLKEDKDIALLSLYQGNAHFLRAYYYFNLAIRYGKLYKKSTANTDLSVPLVEKYNPFVEQPGRSTNEKIYNFILEEIDLAKKGLDSKEGKPMAEELTKDAVLALEARVRFYMSDWDNSYKLAKELIDSGTYPLVSPDPNNFENMWVHDTSTEEILQMFVDRKTEKPNIVHGIWDADASDHTYSPDFIPTQWMIDLFEDTDLRKAVYFDSSQKTKISGNIYTKISVVSKFKGNPALASTTEDPVWGYIPDGRHAPKVFRIAEMYLIAAEAGYHSSKSDAIDYLNKLRESRGLSNVTVTGGDALLQEIKDERTRELAFEGFRLWDLRRWGMGMKRHDPQLATYAIEKGKEKKLAPELKHSHLAEGPNGYYTLDIRASDPKFIWAIPSREIQLNNNLKGQQNPGW